MSQLPTFLFPALELLGCAGAAEGTDAACFDGLFVEVTNLLNLATLIAVLAALRHLQKSSETLRHRHVSQT